jgi:hypothetical protein
MVKSVLNIRWLLVFVYGLFNKGVTSSVYMVVICRMMVKIELERICKEEVVALC